MLFNSLSFLVFFIVVTAVYFLLPQKGRILWLLLASCYFYMAFVPIYIFILGGTIVIDYIAGIAIGASSGHRRRLFLGLSILANVGILAFFKYANFAMHNVQGLADLLHVSVQLPYLSIILPIGLSFHTFQAMSYTIEVYRGRQEPERNFLVYALYVLFYPQLVAGPIERPQNMLHQFRKYYPFDADRVSSGLKLMLWGLFKKVVVADELTVLVDKVYTNPHAFSGLSLVVATATAIWRSAPHV